MTFFYGRPKQYEIQEICGVYIEALHLRSCEDYVIVICV